MESFREIMEFYQLDSTRNLSFRLILCLFVCFSLPSTTDLPIQEDRAPEQCGAAPEHTYTKPVSRRRGSAGLRGGQAQFIDHAQNFLQVLLPCSVCCERVRQGELLAQTPVCFTL